MVSVLIVIRGFRGSSLGQVIYIYQALTTNRCQTYTYRSVVHFQIRIYIISVSLT